VPNRRPGTTRCSGRSPRPGAAGTGAGVGLIDLDFSRVQRHARPPGRRRAAHAGATAWRQQLREQDLLARYGGEEFGVIVTGLPAEQALAVVERLRRSPERADFSGRCRGARESPAKLVRRADLALYRAKEAGRDRIVVDPAIPLSRYRRPCARGTVNPTPARA